MSNKVQNPPKNQFSPVKKAESPLLEQIVTRSQKSEIFIEFQNSGIYQKTFLTLIQNMTLVQKEIAWLILLIMIQWIQEEITRKLRI